MAKTTTKTKKKKNNDKELIVIDDSVGMIFESENELVAFFQPQIDFLENEYHSLKTDDDFNDDEQLELAKYLEDTLDEADQVWRDAETFKDLPIFYFIKNIDSEHGRFQYVAVAYVSSEDEEPTFVFTHFPTKNPELLRNYLKHELVYDLVFETVRDGAVEGDALSEGDPLAIGLYSAMKVLRGEKDVPEEEFSKFSSLREETIEDPDEIWRKNDLDGNLLVFFIKEFSDHEVSDLFYIVVTQEEPDTSVHALLFSFPTTDESLVDRYRQGENLQAEEVTHESSH